jgi:hypothetical protein
MKNHFDSPILALSIGLSTACFAQAVEDRQLELKPIDQEIIKYGLDPVDSSVKFDMPAYPVWLSYILAALNIADAQAKLGFAQIADMWVFQSDRCAGVRNLQRAAAQGHQFATYWLVNELLSEQFRTRADETKGILWLLHWARTTGIRQDYVDRLIEINRYSPETVNRARSEFASWSPDRDPLTEPESCPAMSSGR